MTTKTKYIVHAYNFRTHKLGTITYQSLASAQKSIIEWMDNYRHELASNPNMEDYSDEFYIEKRVVTSERISFDSI